MKIKNLALLLAAISPFAAHAGDGVYIYGAGGTGWTHDAESEYLGSTTDTDFDMGWTGLGGLGYAYGNGFRTELEAGYRKNDVDSIDGVAGTGDVDAWSFMVNALYDFKNSSSFTPYIGAGAGIINIDANNIASAAITTVNDSDTVAAAQGIVGLGYKASDNIDLFADYRYIHAFDPSLTDTAGSKFDTEYDNSSVMLGVRISFGHDAPPPAPAKIAEAPKPVPAPKQLESINESEELPSYMVFFDWDRSDITTEANEIIAKAAREASRGKMVRIEVTGHADRSGSDKYNLKLSQKRADAVKRELEKIGVAGNEIVTFAKGEREPLVPTDDGVREPQNRRVEIYYRVK